MNSFRTVSHLVVVTAVMLCGNMSAMYNMESLDKAFGKSARTILNNRYALGATGLTKIVLNKNDHLKSAALETAGFMLDHEIRKTTCLEDAKKEKTFRPVVAGMHFATNLAIRKSSETLRNNGISLETIGNKVALSKELGGEYINPVVKQVAEVVTEPEVLTLATFWVYANCVAPYIAKVASSSLPQ